MPMPVIHDWRPGDRVASIAVREPLAQTGLGTIQRVILDKAVVLWDDGEQSMERLPDLIIGGFDKSKIVNTRLVVSALAIDQIPRWVILLSANCKLWISV